MPVRRFDVTPLAPPERLDNGFVRVDARLTRSGIFSYIQADGSVRREFRPPEEVFHRDALHSFEHAPITDDHPPEMLNAGNARMYTRGHLGDTIKRDGDHVKASMLVVDESLIGKMTAGKTQVSCGYHCDLDETPGEWRGQKYDAVQTNIRGNHVAIVDVGRAGPSCAVRMDGAFTTFEEPMKQKKADNDMQNEVNPQMDASEGNGQPPRDDGKAKDPHRVSKPVPKPSTVTAPNTETYGLEDEATGEHAADEPVVDPVTVADPNHSGAGMKAKTGASRINKPYQAATVSQPNNQVGGLEASRGDRKDMQKITIDGQDYEVAPEVAKHVAGLQARHDAAVQSRLDSESGLSQRISARVALEREASEILGEGTRMDSLNDRQVKEAVLAKLAVKMPANASADYVDARYDAALESAGNAAIAAFRSGVERVAVEGSRTDADQVRADARKKQHGLAPLPGDAVTKSNVLKGSK